MSEAERQLNAIIDAWEALPGGKNYDVRDVEKWLAKDMATAINNARKHLKREPPK